MGAEKRDPAMAQALALRGRKNLEVNGVNDVVRFDEEGVVLSTSCGMLTVEGTSLHVRVLNLEAGTVEIDGKIDAMLYFDVSENDGGERRGFFKKMFR